MSFLRIIRKVHACKLMPTQKRCISQGATKKDLITRLNEGPVLGDGGFVFALEKRGYVKAGPWTPEATVENPEAVKQLHREFARAGADVMQTFTFYASEDKLDNRGNYAAKEFGVRDINLAACDIAFEVANEYDALVCGGICQTPTYLHNLSRESVKDEFRKQLEVFIEKDVDFILAEYFEHVEEAEIAIETTLELSKGKTVACSLCIGEMGDMHGISTEECTLRMANAGASVVGLNCHFGPVELLRGMEKCATALQKNGLSHVHMIVQPLGYHTPDASKQGFIDLPEFPFALEPRICTRFDMMDFARKSYDLGVRYIGGCCGFEPYHIRACAEELDAERGRPAEGSKKHGKNAAGLTMHTKPWVRARASKEYWANLNPASGRPLSPSMSVSDLWKVTQGDKELAQEFKGSAMPQQ